MQTKKRGENPKEARAKRRRKTGAEEQDEEPDTEEPLAAQMGLRDNTYNLLLCTMLRSSDALNLETEVHTLPGIVSLAKDVQAREQVRLP